jgi:endonuclease YncB( thermonuclease family)
MNKTGRGKTKTGRASGSAGVSRGMPVVRFMAWRNRRRRWYVAVTLGVAALLVLADRGGLLLYRGDDLARYDGRTFRVTRVIDGDTLDLDAPDGNDRYTRVRLWGVDTPEMARRDPPRSAEPYAQAASEFTRRLASGQTVRLTLEPHRLRGTYGRLLAFVELPDGTLLNESLLSAGLARADGRWSHRYLKRFERLEQAARQGGAGLWGDKRGDKSGDKPTAPARQGPAG